MTDTFATLWCPLCDRYTAHYVLQRGYECAANVVELRDRKPVVVGSCGHYIRKAEADVIA